MSESRGGGRWGEGGRQKGVGFNFIFEIVSCSEGIGNSGLSKSQPSFFSSPITKMIFKSKAEMWPSSNPS